MIAFTGKGAEGSNDRDQPDNEVHNLGWNDDANLIESPPDSDIECELKFVSCLTFSNEIKLYSLTDEDDDEIILNGQARMDPSLYDGFPDLEIPFIRPSIIELELPMDPPDDVVPEDAPIIVIEYADLIDWPIEEVDENADQAEN